MHTNNSNFIRFLKDEKFIEWRLLQTDELNAYWEDFMQKHPEEKPDIMLAEEHFNNFHLSTFNLLEERKIKTQKNLEQSIRTYNRRQRFRFLTYSAVASLFILVLSLLYIEYNQYKRDKEMVDSFDYIVGNELETQDIKLITNKKSTSFQKNVDIEISNNGVVQVNGNNNETEEIEIDKISLNRLIVPYGKRSTLLLADGSKVWLNSGTVMEFPAQFAGNNREIYLTSGEIYIEVAPDKQRLFLVHTTGFDVNVYGTKFNLTAYAKAPSSVVLVEGSISLSADDQDEMLVEPNEQVLLTDNGTFNKLDVDVNRFISWKNGYLMFDDAPMTEVLQLIERYYNISFSYDKEGRLKELTCSGKIILSENLDNVMTTIALISSTQYKRENDRIYIINAPN